MIGSGAKRCSACAAAMACGAAGVHAAVASADGSQRSGVCIDGVELGVDFAVWIAKVHRLLLGDATASAALLSLADGVKQVSPDKAAAASASTQRSQLAKASPSPFAQMMRERAASAAQ